MLRHPLEWAINGGVIVAAWTFVLLREWWVALIVGASTTLLVWFLWRQGGLGRRREERYYDADGRLRDAYRSKS